MKLAYINVTQLPSTLANSIAVMKMCQALTQAGHQVRLYVPGSGPLIWDELATQYGLSERFEIHRLKTLPVWRSYDFAYQAVRAARQWGAELVYTRGVHIALAGLQRGLPVIYEIHQPPSGSLAPRMFRWFCASRAPKRLVVITEALRQMLALKYGMKMPAEQVIIAPSGVDLERFANLPTPQEARAHLGLAEGFTAVYSGHFYAGRGMDVLFELAKALPEVHFIWAGGKPEHVADWRAKLDGAGVKNVLLPGFIDHQQLPLYQAAADVLLLPHERGAAGSGGVVIAEVCSPLKLFDYMASGRTILSSDLPVLREVLTDFNSRLVPPGDIPAWIQALKSLQADPVHRLELATQARRDASQYAWSARARKVTAGFPPSRH